MKISRPPRGTDLEDIADWLEEMERMINLLLARTVTSAYTPTNVTTDRAFDADATSTAELADVLGTLVADLKAAGVIE